MPKILQVADHHIENPSLLLNESVRWSVSEKEHLSGGDINEIQR